MQSKFQFITAKLLLTGMLPLLTLGESFISLQCSRVTLIYVHFYCCLAAKASPVVIVSYLVFPTISVIFLTKKRSKKNVLLLFTYLFYLRRRLSIFTSSSLLQLWKKTLHLAGKVAPFIAKNAVAPTSRAENQRRGYYRKGSSNSLLLKSSQTVIELRF